MTASLINQDQNIELSWSPTTFSPAENRFFNGPIGPIGPHSQFDQDGRCVVCHKTKLEEMYCKTPQLDSVRTNIPDALYVTIYTTNRELFELLRASIRKEGGILIETNKHEDHRTFKPDADYLNKINEINAFNQLAEQKYAELVSLLDPKIKEIKQLFDLYHGYVHTWDCNQCDGITVRPIWKNNQPNELFDITYRYCISFNIHDKMPLYQSLLSSGILNKFFSKPWRNFNVKSEAQDRS